MTDFALSVEDVTQRFSLRHEKTLRGLVVTKLLRRHATAETFTALDQVSFTIPQGQTVGMIGHNGSGKSTLLKIIGGVLTPTSGQVRRRGTLAALLELGAGFHHDLTGRENVYLNAQVLGIPRDVAQRRFDEIVDFSGVEQFIDTPMKFYSSGMFVRLGFAVAIFAEPDVLLVDEVLAVGDEAFQRKCLDVVRRFQEEGRTIVLVTHDMRQVAEFCDRVVLLDHGHVIADGLPPHVIADFRASMGPQVDLSQLPVTVTDLRATWHETDGCGEIQVEVTFEGSSAEHDPRVEIRTPNDAVLFAVSASDLGLPKTVQGRRRLRFQFRNVPLMAHQLHVVASACGNGAARPWHTERTTLASSRDAGGAAFAIPVQGSVVE